MAYRTDQAGLAFKCNDIKLFTESSTWGTRLSQIGRQEGIVRIITYSLPDFAYVRAQFERRPFDIYLIAHRDFGRRALRIKRAFPDIQVAVSRTVHSKVLLIEPHTVYISSANFGNSGWRESTIGLHSKEAHDWYVDTQFAPLWARCTEVVLPKVTPSMTRAQAQELAFAIQAEYSHDVETSVACDRDGCEIRVSIKDPQSYFGVVSGSTDELIRSPEQWEEYLQSVKDMESSVMDAEEEMMRLNG